MRSKQYDILVVDDDADDRLMLGEAFAGLNCHDRVTMYASGDQFLQELATIKTVTPLPQLIVLDYNMSGLNGAELLGWLKKDEMLYSIPVVMYSTSMSRTLEAYCLGMGALACVEKGITFKDILGFVKHLCEEAHKKIVFAQKEA